MSDSLRIELEREILFATLAGDPVPAYGAELVLTGDGKAVPPGARLVFRVGYDVFQQILADSLFGLAPEVHGNPGIPFEPAKEIELDAELRPELAATLIERGGGARELVQALVGDAPEQLQFVAMTESWLATSVVQEIEAPGGGTLKSGYKVAR
jgi:hypothetical protein